MTCEECIHKSVCYRVDSVQSDYARKCGDFVNAENKESSLQWECRHCGKSIPYMYDFCSECAEKLLGEPPKPFEPIKSEDKE